MKTEEVLIMNNFRKSSDFRRFKVNVAKETLNILYEINSNIPKITDKELDKIFETLSNDRPDLMENKEGNQEEFIYLGILRTIDRVIENNKDITEPNREKIQEIQRSTARKMGLLVS